MHKGNRNNFPRCEIWSGCLPVCVRFKLVDGLALASFSRPTGDVPSVRDIYWFQARPMLSLKPRFIFEGGDDAVGEWHVNQCPFLPFALSVVSYVAPFQDSLTPC